MDAVERYEHNGLVIEIHVDEDASSPREDDNMTKLVIYGGGRHVEVSELDTKFDPDDYAGWDELEAAVLAKYPGCELLPVYRYDHSCSAYSTESFIGRAHHAEWDSGRVGFILVTLETMRYEYSLKRVSQKARERARSMMVSDVACYSQWANGEVYGYVVTDLDGKEVDSCWGYYGIDCVKQEAETAAESFAADMEVAA